MAELVTLAIMVMLAFLSGSIVTIVLQHPCNVDNFPLHNMANLEPIIIIFLLTH